MLANDVDPRSRLHDISTAGYILNQQLDNSMQESASKTKAREPARAQPAVWELIRGTSFETPPRTGIPS